MATAALLQHYGQSLLDADVAAEKQKITNRCFCDNICPYGEYLQY